MQTSDPHQHSSLPVLSNREHELLTLAASGHTDAEIAHRLGISASTVNVYWTRLRTKLGARSRTEAVATAIRHKAEHDHRFLVKELERQRDQRQDVSVALAMKSIVENAPDGILLASSNGVMAYVNEALAKIFGYLPDELRGEHLSKLLPKQHREHHMALVQDYVKDPYPKRMGHGLFVEGLHKSGSILALCVTLSPLQQRECAVVAMVRDYSREFLELQSLNSCPEEDIWAFLRKGPASK